jgi:hypothetical protein
MAAAARLLRRQPAAVLRLWQEHSLTPPVVLGGCRYVLRSDVARLQAALAHAAADARRYSISRAEFAAKLGVHPETISRRYAAAGRKIGRKLFFEPSYVEQMCAGSRRDDSWFEVPREEAARRMQCSLATVARRLCGKGRKIGRRMMYYEADVAREERYSKNTRLLDDMEFCRLLGAQTTVQLGYLRREGRQLGCPAFPRPARSSKTHGEQWYYLHALEYVIQAQPVIAALKGKELVSWKLMGGDGNRKRDEEKLRRRRQAAAARPRMQADFYNVG